MPQSKAEKKQMEKRKRRVEQLLAMQVSSSEIQRQVCDEFGCSARTVRQDIQRTYERWEVESEKERPLRRHQMRQSLRALMQRAVNDSQWNVAIQACDRLCRLDGLFEPMKAEVNHKGSVDIRSMTSDDKRRRLLELMETARERAASRDGEERPN